MALGGWRLCHQQPASWLERRALHSIASTPNSASSIAAGGDTVSMGWLPESGFLAARWAHFDEGLLLYVLGTGSPTHPLPPESWHAVHRPMRDGYIYLPAETLFVYQYPLAWLDLRHLKDAYANYAVNAARLGQNRL